MEIIGWKNREFNVWRGDSGNQNFWRNILKRRLTMATKKRGGDRTKRVGIYEEEEVKYSCKKMMACISCAQSKMSFRGRRGRPGQCRNASDTAPPLQNNKKRRETPIAKVKTWSGADGAPAHKNFKNSVSTKKGEGVPGISQRSGHLSEGGPGPKARTPKALPPKMGGC